MPEHEVEAVRAALAPRYQVERELASGGMARVYLAVEPAHQRQVAIKVYCPEIPTSRGLSRFLREIRVTESLNHQHILPVLDSGQTEGFAYYVMPYVRGESLRERIERDKQLPVEEVLRLVSEIASGLDAAHDSGIVHRDVKPGNILLEDGHAIVADFGIGRAASELGRSTITSTGVAVGTPLYMSPEQATGTSDVDRRSDIYSLGCLAYEMLVGEPPFTGPTAQAVIAKKLSYPPAPITAYRDGLTVAVDTVIRKALSRTPVDRFQTAGDFATELAKATRSQSRVSVRTRLKSTAAIGTAFGALAAAAVALGANPPSWWPGQPSNPETLVVIPFHSPSSTPAEDSLATDLVDELTRQLNNWDGVIAVPRVSLAGPMFDLGLRGPVIEIVDDGLRIARQVGSDQLLSLSVDLQRDSAWVTASFFDAGSGDLVGTPVTYGGVRSDLFQLTAPLISQIVGVDAPPTTLAALGRYTRSPTALAHYQAGRRLLEEWKLSEAEESLKKAIAADSAFAMAQYYLALTFFWRTARDQGALATLGPTIGRLTQAAVRNAGSLSEGDRSHIEAFHAFQLGDFQAARAAYRRLVARDSTDVNAWLLLGSVEFFDPWLEAGQGGKLAPRSNLNVAVRAFTNTVRLSPGFHLGYGHLFDIHQLIAAAASRGQIPRFETPRDVLIAPWEPQTPFSQESFVPVVLDSIEWLDPNVFESLESGTAQRGVARFDEQIVRLLRRWINFAPGAARPHEEMASWVSAQLARLAAPASPVRIDSLAAVAREEADVALELSADTLPTDLFRLAELHLLTGDVDEALRLTDIALARLSEDDPDRRLAGNVLMATGQAGRLLRLNNAPSRRERYALAEDGGLIPYGQGLQMVDQLEALGAVGVAGEPLQESLRQLRDLWSSPDFSEDEQTTLYRNATRFVAGAVALESSALRTWLTELADTTDPTLSALLTTRSDPDRSREALAAAERVELDGLPNAQNSYLVGIGHQLLGNHSAAAQWFTRIDSIPVAVGEVRAIWGYRSLSQARRASSYDAIGDPTSARLSRDRFSALWRRADQIATTQPWLTASGLPARPR